MGPFDFQCVTRVVAGPGTVDRVGAVAQALGGTRALLVADHDALTGGRATSLATTLSQHGVAVVATVEVESVAGPVSQTGSSGPAYDVVLALGGTRSFETAVASAGPRPIIGLPTTASSGEGHARCAALILDPELSLDVPDAAARAAAIIAIGRTVEAWVTSRRTDRKSVV